VDGDDPQRHRDRLGLAEHNVTPDGRSQLIDEDRAVYRLKPRFRLVQVKRPTLAGNGASRPLTLPSHRAGYSSRQASSIVQVRMR
jgi:hypothetical protein